MASIEYTSPEEFESGYKTLQSTFASNRTKSIKWRKWQLKQLWWLLEQNLDKIVDALHTELNRHAFETLTMEVRGIKGDIVDMLEHIDEWSQGEKPDAGFVFGTLGKAWLRKEPLGVTLIIAAWNFPLYTLLSPMVAAIAAVPGWDVPKGSLLTRAGNCIFLKPSELAPATQALLVDLVPKYLDQSAIRLVTGGPAEVGRMLEFKFNHIFYTGGGKVGRIIATAAAKHLTPVVLELGGQAPVIVTKSADIELAAKRIAHAKLTNSGQVCLNGNHIFADAAVHDRLLERLQFWFDKFLETGNEQFATIINERHFDRIAGLLKSSAGVVVYGGDLDRERKYIKPTIVRDVMTDDSLMSEELFAPIAPVIVADVDRAIRIIRSMPPPLGLYIFSKDQAEIDHILDHTSSGGVTINDLMIHAGVPHAPFGGVGESGYGSYHGKYGFDAFSHTRTVVAPPTWLEVVMSFRYAPFDMKKAKFAEIKSSLVGKPGETMEEQKVGKKVAVSTILRNAVLAVAVLAAADSATGGKLFFVHTMRDVVGKVWRQK
ncbi:hypothetical protein G647_00450 [Cladophialophora carrionii CBS 160.54]|uniref:Aldehyde dehydrogenase n=1 Tax=Cladophialophora carrionii CBS 160.54 TaxID=1279043 RepID=V9DMX8_9EURO|nr:uncharacterized protein G647_00450 [Cladophialophora carrionii CBS 160.54]ETI28001.1 hypothetical protein G647_00450 [Cladophialophora carrionii CBS 160.54]